MQPVWKTALRWPLIQRMFWKSLALFFVFLFLPTYLHFESAQNADFPNTVSSRKIDLKIGFL